MRLEVKAWNVKAHTSRAGNRSVCIGFKTREDDRWYNLYLSPESTNQTAREIADSMIGELGGESYETVDEAVEDSGGWKRPDWIEVEQDGEFWRVKGFGYGTGPASAKPPAAPAGEQTVERLLASFQSRYPDLQREVRLLVHGAGKPKDALERALAAAQAARRIGPEAALWIGVAWALPEPAAGEMPEVDSEIPF